MSLYVAKAGHMAGEILSNAKVILRFTLKHLCKHRRGSFGMDSPVKYTVVCYML